MPSLSDRPPAAQLGDDAHHGVLKRRTVLGANRSTVGKERGRFWEKETVESETIPWIFMVELHPARCLFFLWLHPVMFSTGLSNQRALSPAAMARHLWKRGRRRILSLICEKIPKALSKDVPSTSKILLPQLGRLVICWSFHPSLRHIRQKNSRVT